MYFMKYVDTINTSHGGEDTHMYSTAGTKFKTLCMQNKLKLLDASVRHLGTDINYIVLENMYNEMKEHIDFYFNTPVTNIEIIDNNYRIYYKRYLYGLQQMYCVSWKKRKQMD